MEPVWIFGYGSLLFRPGFESDPPVVARLDDWERRLEQGSPDHRGTPDRLGRVATLVPSPGGACWGAVFRVAAAESASVLAALDHRERGGYVRARIVVHTAQPDTRALPAVTWVATPENPYFLGPAPVEVIARQVRDAAGPSGTNADYVRRLAATLRRLGLDDPHIFAIEAALDEPR